MTNINTATNLLDAIKSNNTRTGSTKQSYSLNEILFIMSLLAQDTALSEVAAITGRSQHTLRYKFLEGEVVLNGKAVVRSVKKYKDMQELFADHKAEFLGDEDVKARIEAHRQVLEQRTQVAV